MPPIKNPLISVIMSCYKSNKEHLKQSIESILNQTYNNFEFLIADNGEDFDLKSFLNNFNDNRIKYIKNNPIVHPASSYDNLAMLAKGEYVAIQDHDDISMPNRLEMEKNALDAFPEIQSVSGGIHIFGIRKEYNDCPIMSPEKLKEELIFCQPIRQPTWMKRKNFCEQYKYDPNWMIYDYEFWSRTREIPHFIIGFKLLDYRKSISNTGKQRSQNIRNEHRLIVQRNLKELGIIAPIELCEMLDPFNHSKHSFEFIEIFKKNKDKLLVHISEELYNKKLEEIIKKTI